MDMSRGMVAQKWTYWEIDTSVIVLVSLATYNGQRITKLTTPFTRRHQLRIAHWSWKTSTND